MKNIAFKKHTQVLLQYRRYSDSPRTWKLGVQNLMEPRDSLVSILVQTGPGVFPGSSTKNIAAVSQGKKDPCAVLTTHPNLALPILSYWVKFTLTTDWQYTTSVLYASV